jgi:hypothetical protein
MNRKLLSLALVLALPAATTIAAEAPAPRFDAAAISGSEKIEVRSL